jgi:putative Mn2+ efflux pump MntP
MNHFEIVILALALVFNSWATYANAGIVLSKEPFLRKVYYTGIMFFSQFLITGVGIWVGYKVGSFELRVNMLISLSILLFIGLKVLLTNIRNQPEEKEFDYTDNKVLLVAALAEGITPLIVGIAIGLLSVHLYLHWLVIGIFLLAGILIALMAASRKGFGSSKLRIGTIGGFLILAVSLKLILSLTSFGI